MPRRRRRNAFADLLDDAVDTAVDSFVDRASEAVDGWRQRMMEQQREQLPPDYLAQSFQCTGCKKAFRIDDMEQVHPTNGWGTCKGCYAFMWKAGREKAREFAKRTARAGARQARPSGQRQQRQQPPPSSSGAPPPPWELLGVSPGATVEQIKKAYRKKAMLYHPDRIPGTASTEDKQRARAMFEAVTRARDVMLKVRSAPTE